MIKEIPIVSIIIPCFNREKLIPLTLDSIRSQTFQDFEAIVVDDGSTDGSLEVISEYSKQDPRIHLIPRNKIPKGAPTCRNIGIKQAKGKYIIFLDSDDLLAPFCLERRVAFMEKRTDLDFAVFPGLRFKEDVYDTNILISSRADGDLLPYFLSHDIPWGTLNVVWKKERILEKKLQWVEEIKSFQDIQFHVDSICLGFSYYLAEAEPDCFWREHHYGNIGKNLESTTLIDSHILLHNHLFKSLKRSSANSRNNMKRLNSFLYGYFKSYCFSGEIFSAAKILRYLFRDQFISRKLHLILAIFLFSKKVNRTSIIGTLYSKFISIIYHYFIWPWLISNEKNKIYLTSSYKKIE
jgi:glycosyltransferase involved in cell wall biosynthesis